MIESEREYYGEEFSEVEFPKGLFDVNFRKCSFMKVDFSERDLSTLYFEECEFENCDFSNATFSKFTNKSNKYIDSKMLGVNIVESFLDNCLFKNCFMQYSNLSGARINKVKFVDCNLEESSFVDIEKINKLEFDTCNLSKVDFFQTKLKGIDLRTSIISGMKVYLEDLRGVIVTSSQASEISTILGLEIKEIGEE